MIQVFTRPKDYGLKLRTGPRFRSLSFTVASGALPSELSGPLLLVIALSMLLTPALFIFYDKVIAPRYAEGEDRGGLGAPGRVGS